MSNSHRSPRLALIGFLGLLVSCGGESPAEPTIPPLSITTETMQNAIRDASYSQQVIASGGQQPLAWSLSAGSLPPGLDLDAATGRISGTPLVVAEHDFTVEVSSADGQTSAKELTIGVFAPLEITTPTLPSGIQDAAYSAALVAAGGDGNHTWTTAAGSLPDGLALESTTGTISGTPTATGSSTVTFEVESGDGQSAQVPLDLHIHGVLTSATSSLPTAVQGVGYQASVAAVGGDGSYTWSVASGALPSGLTLEASSGVISGTPTSIETQTFTVEVSSGDDQSHQIELSIAVYELLEITGASLANGTQAIEYADTLRATGGDGVYSWTVVGGALPGGLSLTASTGQVAGAPALPGSSNLTVQVESGDGQTTQAALSLTIVAQVLAPADFCSQYPPESHATFEDPVLEAAVRSALGAQGPLTCERLDDLTFLHEVDTQITSIGGIQNATGLTLLGLERSFISDLQPLASLTALERLQLGDNSISDISALSGLTSLSYLSLGENSITDITALAGLTGLTTLFLHANTIVDVAPLSGLANLDLLWLGENQISDIGPLASLTGLSTLLLLGNSIMDISPLAGLTGLEFLVLDDNPITDLSTIAALTGLEQLVLGQLGITDISFLSGLTNLWNVALNANQITDLSPLSGLTQLTQLNVAFNAVSALGPLSALTSLEEVTFSYNPVSDLAPLAGLTALRSIAVNNTSVADLTPLQALPAIQYLNLGQNPGLSDIQPLLDNAGIGTGDYVLLGGTSVACADVTALEAKGATVQSTCP